MVKYDNSGKKDLGPGGNGTSTIAYRPNKSLFKARPIKLA